MSTKKFLENIAWKKFEQSLTDCVSQLKTVSDEKQDNENKTSETDINILYSGPEGEIYFPKTKKAYVESTKGLKFFKPYMIDFNNPEDMGNYIIKLNNGKTYKINLNTGYFADNEKYIVIDDDFDIAPVKSLFDKIFMNLSLDEKVKFFLDFYYKCHWGCLETIPCHKFSKKYMKNMLNEYKNLPKNTQKDLLYSWIIGKNAKYPDDLNEENLIEHIYLSYNPMIWNFIDKKYIKSEYFLKYLPENGNLFQIMHDKYKTPEICDLAISKRKGTLYNVPHKHKTPELCKKAVWESPINFKFVPNKFRTEEMCEFVFGFVGCWEYLGDYKKYTKDFIKLFNENPRNLEYLPQKMRTFKRCELALRHYPIMERHIPQKIYKQIQERKKTFNTYEICFEKIKTGEIFMKEVPEHLITQELCDLAVETRDFYFSYVPRRFVTESMCRKVLETSGYLLQSVPKDMRTEEFYLLAYNAKRPAWASIPEWVRKKHNLKEKKGCP